MRKLSAKAVFFISKSILKIRKKVNLRNYFFKTSSLSGDKILLSKKGFFSTKDHYKYLILRLLSIGNQKKQYI